jgi:MFS family permease
VLALAYLGFGMLGLGVSVIGPMGLAWVGRLVANRDKALAISRVTVIAYSGFFIGPPTMGALSEAYNLSVSFTAVAVVFASVPLILLPWMSRMRAP